MPLAAPCAGGAEVGGEGVGQHGLMVGENGVGGSELAAEDVLVGLGAAGEEGGDHGDADAAAEVAHEIEDAGGVAHLFVFQRAHGQGGHGDEDQGGGEAVDDVGPDDVVGGDDRG